MIPSSVILPPEECTLQALVETNPLFKGESLMYREVPLDDSSAA